jgi:hypothetical protein
MYKVTIQTTPVSQIAWKVETAGTWTPGQQPELEEHIISGEVLEQLFNVAPPLADNAGRNEITIGETSYAVVFRRHSNRTRNNSPHPSRPGPGKLVP